MNLAALLIPPSLDAKQALRLRRFGLAAFTYTVATALVAVAWTFGVIPASTALAASAAFFAINLGLYAAIRSGFNLRFEDPSLTRFQILAAITVVMYIIYHMDDGRNVVLFSCFIVFLFGVFHLNAREFTVVTLYALAAYALVINLLMQFRPQAIRDVPHELMSWLALAVFLPYFAVIGGHINTLRRNLRQSETQERERRESELRFRSLTEMSSDFYWESDAGHRLTTRGSAAKASSVSMFQQGAQVGQFRWEIPYLSPDEAGWQAHREVLDAHQPFREFELSRRGTDGTERYISISGDPVFNESGAFTGYRGVGTDITARKRAEQALQSELRRHRALMETAIDGIHIVDQNGRLVEANPAFLRMIGYAKEEAMGLHVTAWDVHSSPKENSARIASLLTHSEILETKWRRKDGSMRDVDLSISALQIEGVVCFYCAARDITDRKRAEARLQKLSHAVEQSPAATAITDTNGRFEYVNPKFLQVTGYTEEDLIGTTPAIIQSGLTLANVYDDLWRTVLSGREWRGEMQNRRKNGELYWEYEIVSPLKNEHGEIVNFIAVKEDITERKQAQDALRDSENLLRLIVENVPARIFWKDRDLRYLGCNTLFAKDAGYSRTDELTGKTDFEMGWKDRAEMYRGDDNAVLESNAPQMDIEEPLTTPEGNTIWLRTSKVPLRDKDSRIIGVLGLYQDITERKQAEEEVRSFAKFPAENPYPVLRISRNGTILHANQASAPILTTWGREVGQAVPDDWQKWIAATLESGMAKEVEIECNRRIFSCTLVPILAEEYVNVYGRDITERKQAEAALQQEHASLLRSQRELLNAHESLAEADRLESVGRLAAGVAHEVKNPLTIVRLGVDYLAKQFSQEGNQQVLDKVRGAIDRADNVIGDLLEFSRQKPFDQRPTSIDEVIDHAINLIKHEIDRRNIVIIRNRDDPMPPIDADPDRLVQVFINLLTNAAQAIGQGGSIEIVTRSICLNERDLEHAETGVFRPGEPVVSVDIRDTGPGISAGQEKKLFEPFFTTKPTGEGTGLGLAVSRNIVIKHRGSIRISNRPAGGASALLMFRVAREHSTNEKANTGSR